MSCRRGLIGRDFGSSIGDVGGEASLSDEERLRLVLRDSKKASYLLVLVPRRASLA